MPILGPASNGADGETRTLTTFATAPSRRRVYQFHHVGVDQAVQSARGHSAKPRTGESQKADANCCHFGMSFVFESGSAPALSGTGTCGAIAGAFPGSTGWVAITPLPSVLCAENHVR